MNLSTVPAVRGVAMEVPLIVAVALGEPRYADTMLAPGARKSTQEPKLLQLAMTSRLVVAPTVIT